MGWKVWSDRETGTVVAVFKGQLTGDEGRASAEAFVQEFGDENKIVTFDVGGMLGYDREARLAWQSALMPIRRKIRGMRVVGARTLIRMGATMLGTALGIKVEFINSIED